jgi:hypothetical protein
LTAQRNNGATHKDYTQEISAWTLNFHTKLRDISLADRYPQKRPALLTVQRAKFGEETPVTRQDEELPRPVVNDWASHPKKLLKRSRQNGLFCTSARFSPPFVPSLLKIGLFD